MNANLRFEFSFEQRLVLRFSESLGPSVLRISFSPITSVMDVA